MIILSIIKKGERRLTSAFFFVAFLGNRKEEEMKSGLQESLTSKYIKIISAVTAYWLVFANHAFWNL